ncbi:MAG: hypothetical protein H8E36_05280 [Rhodospirillaceae bacterium]|nr:hypothetical protein [Rhodospirillaceae bacterium]
MMDFKEIGGPSGLSVTSMLVQNAVAKNRELKELIDKPTQSAVEEQPDNEKAATKVAEASSQDNSNSSTLNTDQPTGRVVNVKV